MDIMAIVMDVIEKEASADCQTASQCTVSKAKRQGSSRISTYGKSGVGGSENLKMYVEFHRSNLSTRDRATISRQLILASVTIMIMEKKMVDAISRQ